MSEVHKTLFIGGPFDGYVMNRDDPVDGQEVLYQTGSGTETQYEMIELRIAFRIFWVAIWVEDAEWVGAIERSEGGRVADTFDARVFIVGRLLNDRSQHVIN
jgi:hypothetical protein